MNNGIIQRLKKLEQRLPEKMVILINVDGEEKECTVDELELYPGVGFVKVLSGSNVIDVDKIIDWVDDLANT